MQVSSNWKKLSKQLGIVKKKKLSKDDKSQQALISKNMDLDSVIDGMFQGKDEKLGKFVAIYCDSVKIGTGGKLNGLARISVVNYNGTALLDTFVKPVEKIVDYNTKITGITKENMENAVSFTEIQQKIHDLISGKIVIGFSLQDQLKLLLLNHPRKLWRDISQYEKFNPNQDRALSLRKIAQDHLYLECHDNSTRTSLQDAKIAMLIFRKYRSEWEKSLSDKKTIHRLPKSSTIPETNLFSSDEEI